MLKSSCRSGNVTEKHHTIRASDSVRLSEKILHCALRGVRRIDFLLQVTNLLLDVSECDAVEIRLSDGDLHYRWEVARRPETSVRFDLARWTVAADGTVVPASSAASDLEWVCREVACRQFDPSLPFFTTNGSFWTRDGREPLTLPAGAEIDGRSGALRIGGTYRSLVVIRFFVTTKTLGLLLLKSESPGFFMEDDVEFFEGVAQTVGLAVAARRAEAALRERVKELTCLYGIAQAVEQPGISTPEMLRHIVELVPPAWQHPEICAAKICLDGVDYATRGFRDSEHKQTAEIVAGGVRRGSVEVVYLEERPEFPVGAFLPEEQRLINAIAREVSTIIERKESQEERSKLHDQLVHADRLATIGQLAAGVAHELNEPLGSILGFAQLAEKCADLPAQAREDVGRIVSASLYARDVIKKLLVFARQMPPSIAPVNLNEVVKDGLSFLEARCAKVGIEIARDLAADLPEIEADPAQLNQVLVNMVVNAVQAMPDGGRLTIGTAFEDEEVVLVVEDTGVGMEEEIMDKIFLPFFTTKDVDEGTGLGLAVVHGIVTSHGGSIAVESRPAKGSRFTIRLPTSASRPR